VGFFKKGRPTNDDCRHRPDDGGDERNDGGRLRHARLDAVAALEVSQVLAFSATVGVQRANMPFETRDYITAAGICVAAVTALSIAHLQRKQMRQIEAYKINPTVGLVPPPNPVWAFIKRHYITMIMAWTVVSLLQDTFSDKPIDRRTIFFIALDLSALVVFLVFKIVHIIIDALLKQAEIQRLTAEFIQQSVAEAVNLLKPPENTKQPE
jgi:hypothetical protein